MKREEIVSVLKVISETYDVQFTELSMEVWFNSLKDFDIKDVQKATWQYVRIGHYKPKPADIIDLIVSNNVPQQPEEMSAQEAWSLVYKAICNSAYNSITEFEKLPEMAQKAVGSADNLRSYALDYDFNIGVAQSNFLKAYNTLMERKKNDYALKIEAVKRGDLTIAQLVESAVEKMDDRKLLEQHIKQ